MFNLSFGELIVLAAIGLIFIGPKQLPQLARILGKTIGELKKAMHEVTTTVASTVDVDSPKEDEKSKLPEPKDPQA